MTIPRDWIDALLRGSEDIHLMSLTFTESGHTFNGAGHLTWQAGSEIRVVAITDGVGSLLTQRTYGSGPMRLIRAEDYLVGAGSAEDDWRFEITPVAFPQPIIDFGGQHVAWDFRASGLSFF